MIRESFVFHAEYIEDLPEENKAQFFLYIYNYGINGVIPQLDGLTQTVWTKIQRRIDADIEAWEQTKIQRSESGRKGGIQSGITRRKKNEANEALLQNDEANEAPLQVLEVNEANEAVSVSVSVSDTVSVIDNVSVQSDKPTPPPRKKFTKPTVLEIHDYAEEKNLRDDSERFFDYHESKGWRIGNAPMKDWKAAYRNWCRNDFGNSSGISSDTDRSLLEQYTPPPESAEVVDFDLIQKEIAEGGKHEELEEQLIF